MATTISSYAFSAPGKDVVGGKEPEEDGSDSLPLPDFVARTVGWSPSGGQVLLGDKDTFCCAYTQ